MGTIANRFLLRYSQAASTLALGSLMATSDNTETLRIMDYLASFWLTDSFTKKFQGNVKVRQKVIPPELSVATLDAWALLASAVEDHIIVDTLFDTYVLHFFLSSGFLVLPCSLCFFVFYDTSLLGQSQFIARLFVGFGPLTETGVTSRPRCPGV